MDCKSIHNDVWIYWLELWYNIYTRFHIDSVYSWHIVQFPIVHLWYFVELAGVTQCSCVAASVMFPFLDDSNFWLNQNNPYYNDCTCQVNQQWPVPGLIVNSLLWSYRFFWWDSQVWIGLSAINQRTHCSCCHTLYWFIPTGSKSITYMFYIIIIQYSSAWPLALNCVHTVHLCPRHPDVTVATQTKHPSPWSFCSSDPAYLTLKATELKPQSLFLQESWLSCPPSRT